MKKNILFKFLFILAILVVGLVYSVLPHFVRYNTLKDQGLRYIPVTLESNSDLMNHYGPRYREIVDGTLIPREIDTYEHKEDKPILFPFLSSTLLTPFFAPFQTIFPGIIMTDFLFPILLLMSFFFILYSFTRHKIFSLFSACILMLFPQLPVLIPPSSLTELKILLFQFIPFSEVSASGLSFLTRSSFIPSAPFFVLMFYFVYQATTIKKETKKGLFIVLAGIFYGLLFYLYLYFWIFATIFLGILFLIFLATKNYSVMRTVFLIGLTGAIVSIPFWINQYFLTQLSSYDDIMVRMGVEEGYGVRWFLWKTYILHIFMAGVAIYLGRLLSKKILGYFLAALALTGIVAYNVNVVTGFTILSDHWGNKVFLLTNGLIWPPLLYYIWLSTASLLKGKYAWVKKILSVTAIVAAVFLVVHVVESSIKENTKNALNYTVPADIMDAYEWLTANTPEDSVVMTPSLETNIELAAYTHNRILQARAQNNLLSKDEVLNRLYITYTFFDISPERFFETIQSKLGVFYFFTEEYNSRALGSHLQPEKYPGYQLPQKVAENLLNEYVHFEIPEKIPYRLDYIFVGLRERELDINLESLEQYEVLYEDSDIVIYEYR